MKRQIALATSAAVVAATIVAVPPALATESEAMHTGAAALGVWLGDLASVDSLNEVVPLTSLDPTGPDGLKLREIFNDEDNPAVQPWGQAVADSAGGAKTVESLADELEEIDDPDVTVTVEVGDDPDLVDDILTRTLTITLARTVEAPLSIVDEAQNIDLRSVTGGPGIPIDLGFTFETTINVTPQTEDFWIGSDPVITLTAKTPDGLPFLFDGPTFESRVGLAEVEVVPGDGSPGTSAITIDKSVDLDVEDADNNGQLGFEEAGSDWQIIGDAKSPGELTAPKTENTLATIDVAAADGEVHVILQDGITILGGGPFDPTIFVSRVGNDPTFAANADYAGDGTTQGLSSFTSIDATELLGGLGQLSNAINIFQRDPLVNIDIPFLDVTLADMTGVTDDLNAFILDATQDDDDTTVLNEFGLADFDGELGDDDTLQEFIAAINDDLKLGASGMSLGAVGFNPQTGALDLPLTLTRLEDSFVALQAFPVDPATFEAQAVDIGRAELGGALFAELGISSLAGFRDDDNDGEFDTVDGVLHLAPPTTTVKRDVVATLAWGVDLTPSEPCTDPCDLLTTPDFEEAETIPVYQRFFLRELGEGLNELEVALASKTTAEYLRGTAGFVEIAVGDAIPSLFELGSSGDHALALGLDFPTEIYDATADYARVQDVTFHFTYDNPDDAFDTFEPADFLAVGHDLDGSGLLDLRPVLALPGGPPTPITTLGVTSLPIDLAWGDLLPIVNFISEDSNTIDPDLVNQSLVVTDNASDGVDAKAALAALNFTPSVLDPTVPDYNPFGDDALFASVVDTLSSLAEYLPDALAAGAFGQDIPFIGTEIGELFPLVDALEDALAEIRDDITPANLSQLVRPLVDKLALDPASLAFLDEDTDGTLELALGFAPGVVDQTKKHDFLLGGDAVLPLVGAGVEGSLHTTYSAGAELKIKVDLALTDGVLADTAVQIHDTSGLSLDFLAEMGQDDAVSVSALGQKVSLGDGGELKIGAEATLGVDAPSNTYVSLADFITSLGGNVGPRNGGDGVACETSGGVSPSSAAVGDLGCAILPVFLNDSHLTTADQATEEAYLRVTIPSFDSFGEVDVDLPDGLLTALGDAIFSFGSLAEIVQTIINWIRGFMQLTGLDAEIPLLDDALDGAQSVADVLGGDFLAAAQGFGNLDVNDNRDAPTVLAEVLQPFKDEIAATGLVRDHLTFAEGGDAADVVHQAFCFNPLHDSDEVECTSDLEPDDGDDETTEEPIHQTEHVTRVDFAFVLGQGDATGTDAVCNEESLCVAKAFDLGLPGIEFFEAEASGGVQAGVAWLSKIGFGINQEDGPYLIPDPTDLLEGTSGETVPDVDALQARAYAGLEADVETRLGLLAFNVASREGADEDPSQVTVDASLDWAASDNVPLYEMPGLLANPFSSFDSTVSIGVDINAHLAAGADIDGIGLPKVVADLDFSWNQSLTTEDEELSDDGLYFALTNVSVDVGSALNDFFGPIFGQINDVVEVADDVRSFVFAPIPVLSELSRMFGGGDVTFVDLAELFGDVDLSLLEDINDVLDFISLVSNSFSGEPIPLSAFGVGELGFVYDPDKLLQPHAPASQAASVVKAYDVTGGTVGAIVDEVASVVNDLRSKAVAEGNGSDEQAGKVLEEGGNDDFTLPIFDDPSCIVTMIAKGDCVILDWTPEELYIEFEYEQPFGPFFGVLYITIGGHAGAGAKFGMGFTTRGIRQAIERATDGLGFDVGDLGNMVVEGIYITDFEGPELYVKAGITAGAKLDLFILEAGVKGGIEATLGFDLIDGPEIDGRVYLDEMATRIFNPLCLFEVVGYLEAFLKIYVEIGPCPFCVEEEFELARVRLLDFTLALADCDKDPVLAKNTGGTAADGSDGVFGLDFVRLYVGDDASKRVILKDKSDESFVIREITPPDITHHGDGTVTPNSPGVFDVSAFGHTQRYEGYWISFDAGDGDDALLFQGSKASDKGADDADLANDTANDHAPQGNEPDSNYGAQEDSDEAPFTAWVKGNLGDDKDAITTGDGNDVISTGSGHNTVATGRGDDTFIGGDGVDMVDLGWGKDTATLGGDNDRATGGPGMDRIDGGSGDDRIEGGRHVVGPDGSTILPDLPGAPENDTNADLADTLIGGTGDDTLFGGPGGDFLHGDEEVNPTPSGTATGGAGGNDVIHGEAGSDTITGGAGNDLILGDETDGGAKDWIWGMGGRDLIIGAFGNDEISGGPGGDYLVGDTGADVIDGDGGDDVIQGDFIGPDAQAFADAHAPVAIDLSPFSAGLGAPGKDILDGGDDNDTIRGGDLDDRINGGNQDDLIFGDDGNDFINGDDEPILADGPDFADWSVSDAQPLSVDAEDDDGGNDGDGDGDDEIYGGAGTDTIHGEDGEDFIRGGRDDDLIFGNADRDDLFGDDGADEIYGGPNSDVIEGGPGNDLLLGNEDDDDLTPDPFDGDVIYGQAGHDRIIGGNGHLRDFIVDDGGDLLYGGFGGDLIIGDNGKLASLTSIVLAPSGAPDGEFGDDKLVGDQDQDTLHGQDGNDELYGGVGDDQLFGELGDDQLYGQDGHDHLVGDQGLIGLGIDGAVSAERVATLADTHWPGGAPIWAVELVDPNAGGEDLVIGGNGDDHLYGGAQTDTMYGDNELSIFAIIFGLPNSGDDWMEGNGGSDEMFGGGGQDDMIGGSSDVNPLPDKLDEGEIIMFGEAGQDVMIGDNGEIHRATVGTEGEPGYDWAPDPITLGRARDVELYDRERRDFVDLDPVSGPDFMRGGSSNDRMWGEGDDDLLKGDAGNDQLFGNQGRDILEGNIGDDDLVGGHNEAAVGLPGVDPGAPFDLGDPDDGDWLFGGGGEDVLLGDNAVITRAVEGGDLPTAPAPWTDYHHTTTGTVVPRGINFLDLTTFTDANAGPDQVSGGEGVDEMFGQDEDDALSGGSEDDYQEGNGHSDALIGDRLLHEVTGLPLEVVVSLLGQYGIPDPVTSISIDPIESSGHPLLHQVTGWDDVALAITDHEALEGVQGPAGQDDQIGGSSLEGHRDDDDILVGDGNHDWQLGDNGLLVRSFDEFGNYVLYDDYNSAIRRDDTQYDVGPDPSQGDGRSDNDLTSGNDWLQGNDGDDAQWGQDGHDVIFGDAGNDDQYGELDWDRMYGGAGEDVMLGDRGDVVNTLITDPEAELFYDTQGPAFFVYEGLKVGQLDRRVDLLLDADGSPLEFNGHDFGGRDYMRGGDDHDSMHGGAAGDWMNGDSGGDWLFGDDGGDAMWGGGGLGPDGADDPINPLHDTDPDDAHYESLVDFLVGGHGADILDFRPRAEGVPGHVDEPIWRVATGLADVDYTPDIDNSEPNQHHQGVDWIVGGFDRDVLQGNVGKNGPDLHDRLIDMVGAFNLYTRCNPSYGDDGDIRQRNPALEEFWHILTYGSGVGHSVQDVFTKGTSAYRELGWVYKGQDGAGNNGSAHDGTPGHFFNTACGAP